MKGKTPKQEELFDIVNIAGLTLEHGVSLALTESRLRYWHEKTGAACFAI